jgi:hypothetical protein
MASRKGPTSIEQLDIEPLTGEKSRILPAMAETDRFRDARSFREQRDIADEHAGSVSECKKKQ